MKIHRQELVDYRKFSRVVRGVEGELSLGSKTAFTPTPSLYSIWFIVTHTPWHPAPFAVLGPGFLRAWRKVHHINGPAASSISHIFPMKLVKEIFGKGLQKSHIITVKAVSPGQVDIGAAGWSASLGGSSRAPARRSQSLHSGACGIQGCCEEVVRLDCGGWLGWIELRLVQALLKQEMAWLHEDCLSLSNAWSISRKYKNYQSYNFQSKSM